MGELIVSTDVLPLDFWHKLGRWSDPLLSDLMGERENGDCHFDACSTLMRTTFTVELVVVAAILVLAIIFLGLRTCWKSFISDR